MDFAPRPVGLLLSVLLALPVFAGEGPWPPETSGLIFGFENALEPALALDASGDPIPGWGFTPQGYGRVRHDGALRVGRGGFRADRLEAGLDSALATGGGFTLSMALEAETEASTNDGAILTLGGFLSPWLHVHQRAATIRVSLMRPSGRVHEDLGRLPSGGASILAIAVGEGRLLAVVGTGDVYETPLPAPLLSPTRPALHLGGVSPQIAGWTGAISHIALYNRALGREAIADLRRATRDALDAREEPPVLRVRATLRAKSTVLSPEELSPYRRGLTLFQYTVDDVMAGQYDGTQLHVAHWTVLDGQPLEFRNAAPGTTYELQLTPYDANPQLETENLSDDIVTDFSIPYFYDAGGRALEGPASPG